MDSKVRKLKLIIACLITITQVTLPRLGALDTILNTVGAGRTVIGFKGKKVEAHHSMPYNHNTCNLPRLGARDTILNMVGAGRTVIGFKGKKVEAHHSLPYNHNTGNSTSTWRS